MPPTRLLMAHEQKIVPLQTLQAQNEAPDQRWPVPYAIMFASAVSAALWVLIIALTGWLIG
jgi:hypothetical protein